MKARLIVLAVAMAALIAFMLEIVGGVPRVDHGEFTGRFQPQVPHAAATTSQRTAGIGGVERLQSVSIETR